MNDSLGDRMKSYENAYRIHMPNKLPVILRLDGKAFHTYTRGLERPYSQPLMNVMNEVTLYLCKSVQNCVMAYTQSDEISLLLVDFKKLDTASWFDNNIQKMVSVAASLASAKLTELSSNLFGEIRLGQFDCRAFLMPDEDVDNYYVWRQQDWHRNSISMLAQSLYSHKELHKKNQADMHEMCFQKGSNWAHLSSHIKNGRIALKRQVYKEGTIVRSDGTQHATCGIRSEWFVPDETPIFTENRKLIQDFLDRSNA